MNTRKILSLGLALIFVFALLPIAGLTRIASADTITIDGVTWTYSAAWGDSSTYRITGCTGAGADLVIPSEINGVAVTELQCGGSSYTNLNPNTSIETITVPDSITYFGANVFRYCSNLTTVRIGNGLTVMGSHAFTYCRNLTAVYLGTGITSIPDYSFYNCATTSKVLDIYFAATKPTFRSGAFYSAAAFTVTLHHASTDSSWGTASPQTLGGKSCNIVGDYDLVPVTPTYNVTVSAANCTVAPASPIEVEEGQDTEITVTPNTGYLISGDPVLTTGATLDSTTDAANNGKKYTLTNVTADCTLTVTATPITYTVSVSDSLSHGSISPLSATVNHGSNATFTATADANYALTSASVTPAGAATVAVNGSNINLTNVTAACTLSAVFAPINYTITATVTGGNGSISPATTSANVENTATITAAPDEGYQIASYTLTPSTAATVAQSGNVFTLSNVTAACTLDVTYEIIPDPTYTDADGHVFTYHIEDNCAIITSIRNAGDNPATGNITVPSTLGGCDVTKLDGMIFGFSTSGITGVTLPDTLITIGRNAFDSCDKITSIVIPENVTTIEASAFFQCRGLTSVVIPASVTTIGNSAFTYCQNLESATFEGVKPTSAGTNIFYNVKSGFTIYYTEENAANWTQYGAKTWNTYPIALAPTAPAVSVTTLGAAAKLDKSAIRFGASFSFDELKALNAGDEICYGFKLAPVVNGSLYSEQTSVGVTITWTAEMKAAATTEELVALMRAAGAKVWDYDAASITFALILTGPTGTTFETMPFAFEGYAELNSTPIEGIRKVNNIKDILDGVASAIYQAA